MTTKPASLLSLSAYNLHTAVINNYPVSPLFAENPTAIAIFGPDQDEELETVIKDFKGKILYISPKCVNLGYETPPRNTVLILEDSTSSFPDCRASNLRAVPAL